MWEMGRDPYFDALGNVLEVFPHQWKSGRLAYIDWILPVPYVVSLRMTLLI